MKYWICTLTLLVSLSAQAGNETSNPQTEEKSPRTYSSSAIVSLAGSVASAISTYRFDLKFLEEEKVIAFFQEMAKHKESIDQHRQNIGVNSKSFEANKAYYEAEALRHQKRAKLFYRISRGSYFTSLALAGLSILSNKNHYKEETMATNSRLDEPTSATSDNTLREDPSASN